MTVLSHRILLGIGANLIPDGYASVRDGCEAAIAMLADPWNQGLTVNHAGLRQRESNF